MKAEIKKAAMERGPGRPRIEPKEQKRRNISLSDAYAEKAKEIGQGNISRGIRIALDHFQVTMPIE